MRKILNGSTLTLGVCYYPEHWPRDMWAADLERMLGCGIQVVSITEFSWNLAEPSEGGYLCVLWQFSQPMPGEGDESHIWHAHCNASGIADQAVS